ncbi:hypothetical protein B0J12DRAFT_145912 [Macrophomina phaseolina]|uniref:Uncharacterized protein n=1 Tax=Macrophomina phaseolina TaxID=35725 RepID=A0ABQ8G617_9PEZI|nr:hypothetical protein B0J12DRAFT_145912 [Macrophomina phaseolina]
MLVSLASFLSRPAFGPGNARLEAHPREAPRWVERGCSPAPWRRVLRDAASSCWLELPYWTIRRESILCCQEAVACGMDESAQYIKTPFLYPGTLFFFFICTHPAFESHPLSNKTTVEPRHQSSDNPSSKCLPVFFLPHPTATATPAPAPTASATAAPAAPAATKQASRNACRLTTSSATRSNSNDKDMRQQIRPSKSSSSSADFSHSSSVDSTHSDTTYSAYSSSSASPSVSWGLDLYPIRIGGRGPGSFGGDGAWRGY